MKRTVVVLVLVDEGPGSRFAIERHDTRAQIDLEITAQILTERAHFGAPDPPFMRWRFMERLGCTHTREAARPRRHDPLGVQALDQRSPLRSLHRKIGSAMVKAARRAASCRGAPAWPAPFIKEANAPPGSLQLRRGGETGDACADDRQRPVGWCRRHRSGGVEQGLELAGEQGLTIGAAFVEVTHAMLLGLDVALGERAYGQKVGLAVGE